VRENQVAGNLVVLCRIENDRGGAGVAGRLDQTPLNEGGKPRRAMRRNFRAAFPQDLPQNFLFVRHAVPPWRVWGLSRRLDCRSEPACERHQNAHAISPRDQSALVRKGFKTAMHHGDKLHGSLYPRALQCALSFGPTNPRPANSIHRSIVNAPARWSGVRCRRSPPKAAR